MIKVYIFVTGLVLYQLPAVPGGTTFAVLAAGGYDYPGLARIEQHKVSFVPEEGSERPPLKRPVEARFYAPCPSSGCPPEGAPANFPNLATLLAKDGKAPRVQPGCISFGVDAECHPAGLSDVEGRNGLLAFEGHWEIEALTDCIGGTYPSRSTCFATLNFVRAGRAWELLLGNEQLLRSGSTLLFSTTVSDLTGLVKSNPELAAYLEATRSTACSGLPDFMRSGAQECVILVIRNGPEMPSHGGGDLHFAALYALLEETTRPDPKELWLPLGVGDDVCPGGGGTGGMSGCTGGLVPGN